MYVVFISAALGNITVILLIQKSLKLHLKWYFRRITGNYASVLTVAYFVNKNSGVQILTFLQ